MAIEHTTDDPTQAAIQKVLGAKVCPFADPQGKTWFGIEKGHEESLRLLYENAPVGALDALTAVKAMRAAIWSLKGHGVRDHGRKGR